MIAQHKSKLYKKQMNAEISIPNSTFLTLKP